MGKFIDLTGQRFGRLVALHRGETVKNGRSVKWYCKCDCGNFCWVSASSLKSGNTKSCGCLKLETSMENGKNNLGRRLKENIYVMHDSYTEGFDEKGNSFLIDIEDYEKCKQYCWYLDSIGYWHSSFTDERGNHHIKLHKFITQTNSKEIVDHINRNKNDNRKCNLRKCTLSQNARNSSIAKNNTSGIIGVSYNTKRQEWKACVSAKVNGVSKEKFLGWYKDKKQAIIARLRGELKYYGKDFAPQRHLFKQYGIEVDE